MLESKVLNFNPPIISLWNERRGRMCVESHTLYNTLILPHFHYCLLLLGSSIKENHPLHSLQKKAVRIIDNSHYLAHTEPICKVQTTETSGHVFNCTMEILLQIDEQ